MEEGLGKFIQSSLVNQKSPYVCSFCKEKHYASHAIRIILLGGVNVSPYD